jgi:hypothetical protein
MEDRKINRALPFNIGAIFLSHIFLSVSNAHHSPTESFVSLSAFVCQALHSRLLRCPQMTAWRLRSTPIAFSSIARWSPFSGSTLPLPPFASKPYESPKRNAADAFPFFCPKSFCQTSPTRRLAANRACIYRFSITILNADFSFAIKP